MRQLLSAALSVVAVMPLGAQTIIQIPKATIEIIGLKRWTKRMIDDSLAKYAPADSLTGHACAAILRDKLHFADASVSVFTNQPEYQFKTYIAITVVEPSDSAKIVYKPALRDSLPPRAEWAAVVDVFKKHSETVQRALQTASFFAARLSAADSATFASVAPLHDLIVSSRQASNLATVVHTLETDGTVFNRVVAAIVLSTFADRDSAWWALVDAQRDPAGIVAGTSMQVLQTMSRSNARPVDWSPVAGRIRHIIDGTNLFGFTGTLRVLVATSVSPSLAPVLLGGGGGIVSAKLRSDDVFAKREASAFLSRLSGLPATSDVAVFERWMAALPYPASRETSPPASGAANIQVHKPDSRDLPRIGQRVSVLQNFAKRLRQLTNA